MKKIFLISMLAAVCGLSACTKEVTTTPEVTTINPVAPVVTAPVPAPVVEVATVTQTPTDSILTPVEPNAIVTPETPTTAKPVTQ